MDFMIYYLSLGSNLGDRLGFLTAGMERLGELGLIGPVSPPYRTRPVGMAPGTPEFLNLALRMDTRIEPRYLLRHIKEIETALGRDMTPGPARSRPLDIDILLAGDRIIDSPELTIPHPRMKERLFVLVPLARIAPRVVHPVLGMEILELARRLEGSGNTPEDAVPPFPGAADSGNQESSGGSV